MPTKDYDPMNELIEAIHNSGVHAWPTIKATTDTKGNVYISYGSTDECVTAKPSGLTTYKPVKIVADGSLPIVEEKPVHGPFEIRSVLSNRKKNAFSVVWMDGTTTVVHCQEGDEWDDEKALAMCFTKKALGNKGNFNDKFNDALDKKMKIIPGLRTITVKGCDCDGTCKTCTCDITTTATIEIANDVPTKDEVHEIVREALAKVAKPAEKAAHSMADMINALTESNEEKSYELYLVGTFTNTKKLVHRGTINVLRDFIKRYAVKADLGYYFRTWNADDGMYLDYGSYTQYFFIPGITNSEYSGK